MFKKFLQSAYGIAAAAGLGALIIAAGFYYARLLKKSTEPSPTAVSVHAGDNSSGPTIVAQPLPNAKIIPPYQGQALAALRPDPDFLKQLPPDRYQSDLKQLAVIASALAANPDQSQLWKEVASLKHFYNDNIGARDAYEYLNLIASGDPIPFYNLALIYGYDLKDPARAVSKFEAAIKLDPKDVIYHIAFADFYREIMHDLPAAEQTLIKGLAQVPNADYYTSLGSLEKQMGNISRAISYYQQALDTGMIKAGNKEAVESEIERLKQAL